MQQGDCSVCPSSTPLNLPCRSTCALAPHCGCALTQWHASIHAGHHCWLGQRSPLPPLPSPGHPKAHAARQHSHRGRWRCWYLPRTWHCCCAALAVLRLSLLQLTIPALRCTSSTLDPPLSLCLMCGGQLPHPHVSCLMRILTAPGGISTSTHLPSCPLSRCSGANAVQAAQGRWHGVPCA